MKIRPNYGYYSKIHTTWLVLYFFIYFTILNAQGGGYALDFDGTDDYVEISHSSSLMPSDEITISAWVKPVDLTSTRYQDIYRKKGEYHLLAFQEYGTVLSLGLRIGSYSEMDISITTSDFVGKWNHIVGVYDGSNKIIYVNGVVIGSTSATGSLSTSGSTSAFIASDEGEENFPGHIDEVRLWTAARTQAQIQASMHVDFVGNEGGFAAYYKMTDGSGTSLNDNGPNALNGGLNNMDNSDWVTSYAPIGDLNSSYETDVEAIWKVSGTSASDASNGLTMTVGSALSTGNFAVYGNNNTSGTSTSDIGSVGSTVRTGRIWQVDECGTVAGTVTIDISDATGNAGQSGTASNFRLLYRSGTSGDFSSAATGASISGDAVSFTSVSLADGYYALGAESDASLPVELTSFEVLSTRDNSITLGWTTESEINNLGFILDRRAGTTDWIEIASFITHTELQGQGSVSHQTVYTYTDDTVMDIEVYDYRIADVDYDGNKEYHSLQILGVSPSSPLPESYVLYQNYPNPFNPITQIKYELPKLSLVNITIYDMMGRVVKTLMNEQQSAGYKSVQWNATNNAGQPVSAGLYLYTIQAGEFRQVRKMVLLK